MCVYIFYYLLYWKIPIGKKNSFAFKFPTRFPFFLVGAGYVCCYVQLNTNWKKYAKCAYQNHYLNGSMFKAAIDLALSHLFSLLSFAFSYQREESVQHFLCFSIKLNFPCDLPYNIFRYFHIPSAISCRSFIHFVYGRLFGICFVYLLLLLFVTLNTFTIFLLCTFSMAETMFFTRLPRYLCYVYAHFWRTQFVVVPILPFVIVNVRASMRKLSLIFICISTNLVWWCALFFFSLDRTAKCAMRGRMVFFFKYCSTLWHYVFSQIRKVRSCFLPFDRMFLFVLLLCSLICELGNILLLFCSVFVRLVRETRWTPDMNKKKKERKKWYWKEETRA